MTNESNQNESEQPSVHPINPLHAPVTTASLLLAISQMAQLAIDEIMDGRNLREAIRSYVNDYPERGTHFAAYLAKDTEKLAEIDGHARDGMLGGR